MPSVAQRLAHLKAELERISDPDSDDDLQVNRVSSPGRETTFQITCHGRDFIVCEDRWTVLADMLDMISAGEGLGGIEWAIDECNLHDDGELDPEIDPVDELFHAPDRKDTKRTKIYFIRDYYGHIKIGEAWRPPERMKHHQGSNARKLKMIGWFKGYLADETAIKKKFKHLKTDGGTEWRYPDEEMHNFIQRVVQFPRTVKNMTFVVHKRVDRSSVKRNENAGQDTFFTSGREVKVQTPEGVRVTRQVHPIHTMSPVPEFSYQYLEVTLECRNCEESFSDSRLYYPEDEEGTTFDPQCPECYEEIPVNFQFEQLSRDQLAAIVDHGPVPCKDCMTPDACRAFGCAGRPTSEGGAPDIQFEPAKPKKLEGMSLLDICPDERKPLLLALDATMKEQKERGSQEPVTDLVLLRKLMDQIEMKYELREDDKWVKGEVQRANVMDLRGPRDHSFAPWVALIFDLDGKLIDMEVEI
jgi:hypothetical protein